MKSQSVRWASVGVMAMMAVAVMGSVATVAAQEGAQAAEPGGVNAQTFRPAIGPGSVIVTEGTETAGHLEPYAGLFVDYFSDPLVLRDGDATQSVVDQQLGAQLMIGIGAFEDFQFELGVPFAMLNDGEYAGQGFSGAGAGDVFGRAKATILSSRDEVMGVGFMLDLTVPTGDADVYRGSPQATASPMIVVDGRVDTPAGELLLATNVGTRLQRSQNVHDLDLGTQLRYGAGMELEVVPQMVRIGADLYGAAEFTEPSRRTNPLELLGAVEVRATDALLVHAGAGGGVVGGVGSPQWRALAGVVYRTEGAAPRAPDPTVEPVDEIAEASCPPEPEGFRGPYDDEGCAITPENYQGCAGLSEDWEGALDAWGCPLLDSDGDGFLVWDDECPFEPVVFIGVDNDDGCPNYDVSGDGIPNVEDHCPLEGGLRLYDGCPPPEDEERAARGDDQIEINERIHFESDKAIILESSYSLLDEVALLLREESDITMVEIAGHTDARGADDYNLMLSEERAKAVREFLIERGGVRAARLAAQGYGSSEPLIDEDSDEAHAENRRVEFRIIEVGDEN